MAQASTTSADFGESVEIVVIGGGIVGVAVARALALRGREVVLLEAERTLGAHTSSRNSEVIHAGIHYPTASLKAELCVSGKVRLYEYCRQHGIPHRRIGKLVVASGAQVAELETIRQKAAQNGVHDLEWLGQEQLHRLEPAVSADAGLFSPSTGIVDSHELLSSLRRDAEHAGALAVPATPVLAGKVTECGVQLTVGGQDPARIHCSALVNAAGLFAQRVSRSIEGLPREGIPAGYMAKGHYFLLSGRSPFEHLVYPVPEPGGLGIHVTLDLAGQARFGPDVTWVDSIDYRFEESRVVDFYRAVRGYYPALADGTLLPGYTGIRPKLAPPGAPPADFVIQGPSTHRLPIVSLYGIESPGLTAALALADRVAQEIHPGGSGSVRDAAPR